MTSPLALTPAAAVLLWLESRGAVVTLDDDDYFWIDMNPITDWSADATPALMAETALFYRDEIRQILIARRRQILH